jgi:cysteine desulfurase
MSNGLVYLDYNATTPLQEEALAEMLPWMTGQFWNSASIHQGGRQASNAVDQARESIAELLGVRPSGICFTSGATEANNLAIKGAVLATAPGRTRIVVGATEHKAVLDPAHAMASTGAEIVEVPVDSSGLIDEQAFLDALDDTVAIVSIMLANNETGVIAPVERLAQAAHEAGALFHTDATQAFGKIPVDLETLGVDMASFSAHKVYGPKGIGALYVARGVELVPLLHGGGHERGLRSGTMNVAGAVGFARAAQTSAASMMTESARQADLVDRLVDRLRQSVRGVEVVGEGAPKLPNTVNIRFAGVDGEALLVNAPLLGVSSGSACTSMTPSPSHVLLAMGYSRPAAEQCLRFSTGRPTQLAEIDKGVEMTVAAVERIRSLEAVST